MKTLMKTFVLITWRDAYIKRKAQKAKIKEELMPVAWHPDRWWDWCVPEHEKKGTTNLLIAEPQAILCIKSWESLKRLQRI